MNVLKLQTEDNYKALKSLIDRIGKATFEDDQFYTENMQSILENQNIATKAHKNDLSIHSCKVPISSLQTR